MEIRVIISLSAGLYKPLFQVGMDVFNVCEYGSKMAEEAMNHNPQHWARDVYKTLDRLCSDPAIQREMQGGNMNDYYETEADRQVTRKIKAGVPFDKL